MADKLKAAQRKLVEHVRTNSKDGLQLELLGILDQLAPRAVFPAAGEDLSPLLAESIAIIKAQKFAAQTDFWPTPENPEGA